MIYAVYFAGAAFFVAPLYLPDTPRWRRAWFAALCLIIVAALAAESYGLSPFHSFD